MPYTYTHLHNIIIDSEIYVHLEKNYILKLAFAKSIICIGQMHLDHKTRFDLCHIATYSEQKGLSYDEWHIGVYILAL